MLAGLVTLFSLIGVEACRHARSEDARPPMPQTIAARSLLALRLSRCHGGDSTRDARSGDALAHKRSRSHCTRDPAIRAASSPHALPHTCITCSISGLSAGEGGRPRAIWSSCAMPTTLSSGSSTRPTPSASGNTCVLGYPGRSASVCRPALGDPHLRNFDRTSAGKNKLGRCRREPSTHHAGMESVPPRVPIISSHTAG